MVCRQPFWGTWPSSVQSRVPGQGRNGVTGSHCSVLMQGKYPEIELSTDEESLIQLISPSHVWGLVRGLDID